MGTHFPSESLLRILLIYRGNRNIFNFELRDFKVGTGRINK